jgi:hypothetical protein
MINTYLNIILKRPLIPILFLAAVTVYLALGILKIQFDSSIESFMPKHDAEYIEYSAVKEIYGDNDRFSQISVAHKHLWHPGTLSTINRMIVDIKEYENFDKKKRTGAWKNLKPPPADRRRRSATFFPRFPMIHPSPVFWREASLNAFSIKKFWKHPKFPKSEKLFLRTANSRKPKSLIPC